MYVQVSTVLGGSLADAKGKVATREDNVNTRTKVIADIFDLF
jgi:hypothetical protein